MPGRDRGLYEVLITEALEQRLRDAEDSLSPKRDGLRPAEAADRVALHLGGVIQRALASVPEKERVAVGISLARALIHEIDPSISGANASPQSPVTPGTVPRALLGKMPDGSLEIIPEPLIPLLDTALLTNAPGEPRVGSQLLAEIHSADRLDIVMAFIRRSGIAPMREALRAHCERGRGLRVLTTTYTGSTEEEALTELAAMGAQVSAHSGALAGAVESSQAPRAPTYATV